MNLNRTTHLLGLFISVILTACFDEGSVSSFADGATESQDIQAFIEISGAAIKGPLAFANVSIYALNTNFDALYDTDNPVATATTNAYAEIKDLKVPRNAPSDTAAPYVLVVDGANAIDLNTNTAPVINKLVTLITVESLNARQPKYATPYTTLAYHMLRLDIPLSGDNGSERSIDPLLATRLSAFNQEIIQALGFGIPAEINIFTTPPIITKDTTSVAQQQQVVYYRAAIEALSSLANEMSLATGSAVTTDAVIQNLASDLHSDGTLDGAADGAADGAPISGININTLTQNPMFLDIPNTEYQVSETLSLIVEERALVGASANVTFFDDDITFDLYPLNVNSGDNSIPAGGTSNTDNYLLQVNFDNRAPGPYAWANIKTDFQVNMHGYNDPSQYVDRVSLVADPADDGHGTVMAVYRPAGVGWGGMQFRADFQKVYDVYFAYDMYLAHDFEFQKQMKNPALMYNTYDSLEHPNNDTFPTTESLRKYSTGITADGNSAWGRGDGALSTYYYDKTRISGNKFWDEVDPTWDNYGSDPFGGNQYHMPRGVWITVEMRLKMNTPNVANGVIEIWVTDPTFNGGVTTKVSEKRDFLFATDDPAYGEPTMPDLGIDGISMAQGYGGDGDDPDNRPSQDQYHYYDNFRVSTNPITH